MEGESPIDGFDAGGRTDVTTSRVTGPDSVLPFIANEKLSLSLSPALISLSHPQDSRVHWSPNKETRRNPFCRLSIGTGALVVESITAWSWETCECSSEMRGHIHFSRNIEHEKSKGKLIARKGHTLSKNQCYPCRGPVHQPYKLFSLSKNSLLNGYMLTVKFETHLSMFSLRVWQQQPKNRPANLAARITAINESTRSACINTITTKARASTVDPC